MGLYGDHRSTSRYHTDVTRALYGEDLPQLKTTHMKLGNRTLESFSLVALASLVLLATSCSKDEETATPVTPTPTGNTNSTANTTPVLTGADGALWAVSTATNYTFPFLGTIQIDVNTGVAVFWDDAGAAIQAGTVKCNDSTLTFTNIPKHAAARLPRTTVLFSAITHSDAATSKAKPGAAQTK